MPPSLHFCFIESGYPYAGGGGGAGAYVRLVAHELGRRGHRASVLAAWHPGLPTEADDEGVQVYRPLIKSRLAWYSGKLPGPRLFSHSLRYLHNGWQRYRFLRAFHRRDPIDLAEFTEGGDFWHAFLPSFPFVAHLHGSRYTFLSQSARKTGFADILHRKFELAFIRRATCVISPSRAMLEIVEGEAGRPFGCSLALPYPLDPRFLEFSPALASRPEKVVLFAARNDPVKGGNVLLDAIPLVTRQFSPVKFHFFGYQPALDAALSQSVEVHEFLSKEALLGYYRSADVCVIPSLWDNSPNTVYEAMAAGLPVIASRVGGIPELVVDGETGLLVPPGDSRALSEALLTLLSGDALRERMGQAARKRIVNLANLPANVDRRLELYLSVMDR